MTKPKFIILAQYRSGSTMLCRTLDTHPELSVGEEILHIKEPTMIEWRKNTINHVGDAQNPEFIKLAFEQINGFKIMLPKQVSKDSEVWQYLLSLPNLKVIFLDRKNILHSIVSMKASMTTNIWQKEKDETHNLEPFYVDPKGLETELNILEDYKKYYSNLFKQKETLYLQYENLIQDWDSNIINIQNFLGVDPIPLTKGLNKLTNNHKHLIKNYKELVSYFKHTKFNIFFEIKLQ